MRWLEHDRLIDRLPGQAERISGSRQVSAAAWAAVWPTPVPEPVIVAHDDELLSRLGISPLLLQDPGFAQVMGGCALYAGMTPWAHNYGGHQFGHWAGQLGDGRAITLGEVGDADGRRWEIQLKGAGPTPFSRNGDGRAVLRSSLREYVASLAMHALGIPTTRAPLLLTTGGQVVRDRLYDGHPEPEPGAIVVRAASSFLRIGSLQLPASRGEHELTRGLIDLAIDRHYPALGRSPDRIGEFFVAVARASAHLVAEWERVGFIHAVLNTDNVHLGGLTVDYGPFAWMEAFDPDHTPNTSDAGGRRYRFGAQPAMMRWNLAALAQALAPLVQDLHPFTEGLNAFDACLADRRQQQACARLGVADASRAMALKKRWERLMHAAALDMTLAWRALGRFHAGSRSGGLPSLLLAEAITDRPRFAEQVEALGAWLEDYRACLVAEGRDPGGRRRAMETVNPWFVPRNWTMQQAIDSASAGDWTPLQRLCQAALQPYTEDAAFADLVAPCPDHLREHPGCSRLSCSS